MMAPAPSQVLKRSTPHKLHVFNGEQLASFVALKNDLMSSTVLKLSRLGLLGTLNTDSSDTQIDCTLVQTHNDVIRYAIG